MIQEWLPSNSAKSLKKRPTQEGGGTVGSTSQDVTPSSTMTTSDTLELATKYVLINHPVLQDRVGYIYKVE